MKKIISSTIFTLLFFGFSFSQEKPAADQKSEMLVLSEAEVNQFNTNGERVGIWKKYFENGKIRYKGQFENGKEVGVFKFYSPISSDFPMIIKTFDKNTDETLVAHFTLKGLPKSKGKMEGKKRIGKWVYYHKNGTIILEENYQKDILNGDYKVFYANGKPTKFAHYKDGKLHGNSKKYNPKGNLIEDVNYVNGELHGDASFYENNGNLKQKGRYEEDLKVGFWEVFMGGELSETKEIKARKKKN